MSPAARRKRAALLTRWWVRHCRQDFFPASKLQTEDDITASVVVPADKLKGKYFREGRKSLKFSQNCEFRLFQVF